MTNQTSLQLKGYIEKYIDWSCQSESYFLKAPTEFVINNIIKKQLDPETVNVPIWILI